MKQVLLGVLLAFAATAHAREVSVEDYQRAEATLPENIGKLVRNARIAPQWIGEEGARFWYVREIENGEQYMFVDSHALTRRLLFDHAALARALSRRSKTKATAETLKLQGVEYLAESDELRFGYADKRWTFSIADKSLTEAAKENSAVGTLSPDEKWRAYVRDGDLYVAEVKGETVIRLTNDGDKDRQYATPLVNPKRVFAAEPDDAGPERKADVVWSKDSQRLAAYAIDTRAAGKLTLVRSTPVGGGKRPQTVTYDYPLTGDENVPLARGMIFEIPSGARVDMDLAPQPILYYYGPDYRWKDDNETLFTLIPSRDYKTLRVFELNAGVGASQIVIDETDRDFVDYYAHWWDYVPEWDAYLWMSERTGGAHLYAVRGGTGETRALTGGDWRFRSVEKADAESRTIYLIGSGREPDRDPYIRHLYRIAFDGGELRLLTPEPLDHDVSVSPDGEFFVDNMSLINEPTRTVLRRADTGEIVLDLEAVELTAFLEAGFTLPEPFETTAADGKTPIFGAIYRPANLDPSKAYPVIDNIYTGPHYVMTPKSFSDALFSRNALSVAQAGFVVVTVDGRGTNRRSRAFLKPARKTLNLVGLDDHEKAIRDIAKRYPYIDVDRAGVYGFSAGGYDAARALFRKPDFYKAGVSASGNHDNRSDKAIWNELWMGYPVDEDLYDRNSNLASAKNLKGDLFLAHGELDENVNPMATLQLVDVLIKENKDFEFLILPGEDHFLDDSPYFNRRRLDFFVRSLLGEEPPQYRLKFFED